MYICLYVTYSSCPILMKHELSRQIFEKSSNIKFRENPSSGNRVVAWGQTEGRTDRHNEAKSRFSKFFERTQKIKHPDQNVGNIPPYRKYRM